MEEIEGRRRAGLVMGGSRQCLYATRKPMLLYWMDEQTESLHSVGLQLSGSATAGYYLLHYLVQAILDCGYVVQ